MPSEHASIHLRSDKFNHEICQLAVHMHTHTKGLKNHWNDYYYSTQSCNSIEDATRICFTLNPGFNKRILL